MLRGAPSLNDAQNVIAALKFPATGKASDLAVAGTVDRPGARYASGSRITLSVSASRDASVAVLRVLRDGVTTIVFPSKSQPDARVAAHRPVQVRVVAGKPGTELFEFIAAVNGASWLFTRKPAGNADYVDLGSTTRAIADDIRTTLKGAPHGTVAVAHVAVRVSG